MKLWREDAPDLTPRERVMLDYVAVLTRYPGAVGKGRMEELRSVGFDDVGISQITAITAFFAFVNRMADGLGVGR